MLDPPIFKDFLLQNQMEEEFKDQTHLSIVIIKKMFVNIVVTKAVKLIQEDALNIDMPRIPVASMPKY